MDDQSDLSCVAEKFLSWLRAVRRLMLHGNHMKSERLGNQSRSGMKALLDFQSSEKNAIQKHGMSRVHTFNVDTNPSVQQIKEKSTNQPEDNTSPSTSTHSVSGTTVAKFLLRRDRDFQVVGKAKTKTIGLVRGHEAKDLNYNWTRTTH